MARNRFCKFLAIAALLMVGVGSSGWAADGEAGKTVAVDPSANYPYGIHAHLPRGDEYPTAERELDLMRDAGIGFVRTGFVIDPTAIEVK